MGTVLGRFWGQHGSQMASKMVPKRLQSRLPDAPRTGVTNRRAFPLFFRFFFLRPMCLKHNKYCIEPTFPSVATPPKNRPKKHRKMRPTTHLNRSKIGPRRLPNEASKNRRFQNPYFQRICRFWARFGPRGDRGGEKLTFRSPERSKRNLGAKMHPRCSQEAAEWSQDPP